MAQKCVKRLQTIVYVFGKCLEVSVNFFDPMVTAVSVFSSTRGYYQLEFVGCFNRTPIPGPSLNFSIIPDPNKPVKLTVNYDTNARFLAGGTFPGLYFFISFKLFSLR